MIFNGEKSGSVGLKHSITVDMTLPMELLKRIEANVQRYVGLNITTDFDFNFHYVSVFNLDERMSQLKDKATLGINTMDYATVDGTSPFKVMNDTYTENALGITSLWTPLSSSYTASGSPEGVKPTKKDDDLSDEAIATRDSGKNEGTKAGK